MPITESDLPGVGKKFEVDLEADGETLVIVVHNTGKREVYVKPDEGADSEQVFELSDQLARKVGSILEGAYFQPIQTEERATTLGNGTIIEWFDVEGGATLEGETIGDILENERINAAIVAVQRGEEAIPASSPDKQLRADDTVVAVGTNDDLEAFKRLLVADGEESI